jgi:hypothetical protein
MVRRPPPLPPKSFLTSASAFAIWMLLFGVLAVGASGGAPVGLGLLGFGLAGLLCSILPEVCLKIYERVQALV